MSKHKVELWPLPAKKITEYGIPIAVIGNETDAFNRVRFRLEPKIANKLKDGQPLSIFIGWED